MIKKSILSLLLISLSSFAFAKSSPLKKADAVSVKATLENMLVHRYTQELSSIVDKKHFNIGARFDLRVINTDRKPQNLEFNDLDLGYLDADILFDNYSMPNMVGANPFEKYSIKEVELQVGLDSSVSKEVKSSVETWLSKRVKEEFGSNGKTKVQYILEANDGSLMESIRDMQGLVGNLVLAIALLIGIVLWKVMGGSDVATTAEAGNSSQSIQIQSKTEMGEGFGGVGATTEVDAETVGLMEQLQHLKTQIKELSPKILDQLESLVTEWCEQGEEGLYLLASFAEISGSVLGSLPIPKEEKKKMSGIFAKMHETPISQKVGYLNKIYWDLISALNLGTDSLHRPFSFIGSSGIGTINNVLLGNDVETQTVVTLYMPDKMRKKYFEGLEDDKRIELLNSAAQLSAISEENLQNIEEHIAPYFGNNEVEESSVSMSMTLVKLIETMTFADACRTLPSIKGPVMNKYKLQTPHLGLLSEWDRSALGVVSKYASNEALQAYLRILPEMKHYVLEFVPPRTKQILEDDLAQPDTMSVERKEELLGALHKLILNLVDNGELSLEDIVQIEDTGSNEKLDIAA